jgi:FkbM family methyltransferase
MSVTGKRPDRVRNRLAAWRDRARVLAVMPMIGADHESRRALVALTRRVRSNGQVTDGTVAVRLRALGGGEIHLRPSSTDIDVVADDFLFGYQLPPREVKSRALGTIWELGTNIGLGLADLGLRYDRAALLGVEPDPENLRLARRNLAGLGGRCELVEAAVWDDDSELVVEGDQEYGLTVRPRGEHDLPSVASVRGVSLNTLLAEHDPGGRIDFMLMDIEGTEQRVLRNNTEWAARVAAIKVELHPQTGYSADLCAADLRRLGFRTRSEPLWWGGFVHGFR